MCLHARCSKNDLILCRLKEQDDCFNQQRQEYEREIRYLRMLVKEKEALIAEMEGDKKYDLLTSVTETVAFFLALLCL